MAIRNIVFIGAGNVATNLAVAFFNKNLTITQVYSRTALSADKLASKINAVPVTNPSEIFTDAGLYIISVSDDAIVEVTKTLIPGQNLFVHTSGTVPVDILKPVSAKYGVFYPLQTFTKDREIEFSNIPLLIEASDPESERELLELGKIISNDVRICNSEKRKTIHLAAVFACNFSNLMYILSEEILTSQQLPFDLLRPLILETAQKVMQQHPRNAQTGPAKRNDLKVMAAHLELLAGDSEKQEIYKLLSKLISNLENRKKYGS